SRDWSSDVCSSDLDAVKILYLEKQFEKILDSEKLPFPVKIAGYIDRVEIRNDRVRILDYKTGKVEGKNLSLSDWKDFLEDETKNKIIQLLCYAYMFEKQAEHPKIGRASCRER